MKTIVIDFETRSEISLLNVGDWVYSKHPSTKPLCLAYKIAEEETKVIDFRNGHDVPEDILLAVESGCLIEAFNVSFEYSIYKNILSEGYNWPEIDFSRFRCTQARALQFSFPRSLEAVSKALGLSLEKDTEGRKIMLQMCKPKKPSKKDPTLWYDDDIRYDKLIEYCKRDVDVTYAIREKLLNLTKEKNNFLSNVTKHKSKELQIFKLNNRVNNRGIKCDVEAAKHALFIIGEHEKILNKRLEEITEGRIKTAGQVIEIVKMFHENKIHIPSLNKANVALWIPRLKGKFKEILEIRQQLSKSSVKKLLAMVQRSDTDEKIRNTINYYGAMRTGRFCIRKGTMIDVVRDLSKHPKGIKIEDVKKGDYVYCYDNKKQLKIRRVKWSGWTKRDKVIRIHWVGQGNKYKSYLDTTPDHKIRLSNGAYIEAQNLKPGDSLLSLSRSKTNEYSRLHSRNTEVREHRFIYKEVKGEEHEHIHHIDHNKLNNEITNLEGLSKSDHSRKHTLERLKNPVYKAFLLKNLRDNKHLKKPLYGKDNPAYKEVSKFNLLKSLAKEGFQITKANDEITSHNVLRKKCLEKGINIKDLKKRYSDKAGYLSRGKIIKTFKESDNNKEVYKTLGISFYTLKDLCSFYDLPFRNHRVLKIEELGVVDDVFDIEVEDYHNFIANEICVHNSGAGIQPQNFTKPELNDEQIDNVFNMLHEHISYSDFTKHFPEVLKAISSCLRGFLTPSRNKVFLDSDFSAIEARVLFWLAEDKDGLKTYHEGRDIYKEMAGTIYNKPKEEINKDERQLGKQAILGCFEGDTKVLTNKGIKNIRNITRKDKVWDGARWVSTDGVVCQGIKKVIKIAGVTVTPDHKILLESGWKTAQKVEQDESGQYLQSALDKAQLQLQDIYKGNVVGLTKSWLTVNVLKVKSTVSTLTISIPRKVQGVICALKKKQQKQNTPNIGGNTQKLYQTQDIGRGCLTDCLQLSLDAIMLRTERFYTMVTEALKCSKIGRMTDLYSSSTFKQLKAGINQNLRWIGLMSTKVMKKGTYSLRLGQRTCIIKEKFQTWKMKLRNSEKKTKSYKNTFDLLNCGVRNRFTILTNKGFVIVHNCGYGMGKQKFLDTCLGYNMAIEKKLADKTVKIYREKFVAVQGLWRGLEEAMISSILNPGKTTKFKNISFFSNRGNTYVSLPSGRSLFYFDTKVKHKYRDKFEISYMSYKSQIKKFERVNTWGGKLTENVVQAIARDFMTEAMLRIDKHFSIIFTVHDQLICEVEKDNADIKKFNDLMEVIPTWGIGAPIKAESQIAERFKK